LVQPSVPAPSPHAAERQIASEIFVLGFPLILMDTIRRAHPLAAGTFRLFPPDSQPLAPGLFLDDPDCLHASAVVNLAASPIQLHLPNTHGRYISVTLIDSAGEAFASLGSRTDAHLAGDIVLAGPAWAGEIRQGERAVRTPCESVWAVSRIIARSAPDHAAVEAFAAEQSFTPAAAGRTAAPAAAKAALDVLDLTALRQLARMEPAALFHRLLQLIDRAPRPVQARIGGAIRERLARLDGDGSAGAPAAEALQRGFADGLDAIQAARRSAGSEAIRDWSSPPPASAAAGPLQHAAAVLGALGAPLREDILTLRCNSDESGRPLSGAEQYRLVMPAAGLPPALSAWRLTAPSRDGRAPGEVIGDHSPLTTDADGGLELFIQRDPPARRRQVNWLRAPDGAFELRLRLYAPTADTLDGSWRMAPVERLGSRANGRLHRTVRRGAAAPAKSPRNLAHTQWSPSA
jgi:hypothetical protein